jgi:uncharacterized membrane protein
MGTSTTGKERYRTNTQDLDWREEQAFENVGEGERKISSLVGGGLMLAGLLRRSWSGLALTLVGAAFVGRGVTGHCMLYAAMGTNTNEIGRRKVQTAGAIKVEKTVRIERQPDELYQYWRNLENLPHVMSQLESVEVINDRLSHWVVKTLPIGGPKVEWDAQIINEVENELIGWRSLRGADVDNAGSVRFRRTDDGKGTDLTVTLQYEPPGGRLGALVAKIFGEDPQQKIEEDLQRFKESMEAQALKT